MGGRPIRPGMAEGNALLLPLEKGRAGEEAPIGVVELLYLQPIEPWADKRRARIELPALDLPVSRTGVELHYSPRFRLDPQPGAFRVDTDPGPFATVLRPPPPPAAPANAAMAQECRSRCVGTAGAGRSLQERRRRPHGRRRAAGSRVVSVLRTVGVPRVRADRRGQRAERRSDRQTREMNFRV